MSTEQKPTEEKTSFQVTDRRFWVEGEKKAQDPVGKERKYPSFVEELKDRTEAAEQKLRERIEQLETENSAFRSRIERQVETRLESTKAEFIKDFLEIADNLELAIEKTSEHTDVQSIKEGIILILALFHRKLQNTNVEMIDNLNEEFDPNESEAVSIIPVDDPKLDHKIVNILQKGYRLGERIIRPAKVQVGRISDSK